jgi:type II secretory pathway component PulM
LDYLKKTIEQQRNELNSMKERLSATDLAIRDAHAAKDQALLASHKLQEDLTHSYKKKVHKYKRHAHDLVGEVQTLTQRVAWMQEEARASQVKYE